MAAPGANAEIDRRATGAISYYMPITVPSDMLRHLPMIPFNRIHEPAHILASFDGLQAMNPSHNDIGHLIKTAAYDEY